MKGIDVIIPSVKFSIFESMERKDALSMQILFSAWMHLWEINYILCYVGYENNECNGYMVFQSQWKDALGKCGHGHWHIANVWIYYENIGCW